MLAAMGQSDEDFEAADILKGWHWLKLTTVPTQFFHCELQVLS